MKKKAIIPIVALFFLFIFFQTSVLATEISDCSELNETGTYYLLNDITNSGARACINITVNDVTLDCQNYKIDGIDSAFPTNITYGILASGFNNTIIKNCYASDWGVGSAFVSRNGIIDNATATSNTGYGIVIYTDNITVKNSDIISNTYIGIMLGSSTLSYGCTNCKVYDNYIYGANFGISTVKNISGTEIYNNNITNEGTAGITLSSGFIEVSNVSIYNNNITNQAPYTGGCIKLDTYNSTVGNFYNITDTKIYGNRLVNCSNTSVGSYPFASRWQSVGGWITGNYIYNNFINSSDLGFSSYWVNNYWNTTKILETNIIGGDYIGGNYWGQLDGNGYSDTCIVNGTFCNPYIMVGTQTDYLPLSNKYIQTCICDSWSNSTCFNDTHRTQLRNCTPDMCDIETQYFSDPNCIPFIPTTQDNTFKGIIIFVCLISMIILFAKATNRRNISDNLKPENIIMSIIILGLIIIMVFLGLSIL